MEIKLDDKERQPCEIWTRVMGYHRPVDSFNRGKKSEYYSRLCFDETKAVERMNREDQICEDTAGLCAAE